MKRINKSLLNKVIIVFLIIGSVGTLFINQGLYHFELNSNIQVVISGENEDVENFLNSISDPNLVRKDKQNTTIYFEDKSFDDVKSKVGELNSENKLTFTISNNSYKRRELLLSYSAVVISMVIVSLITYIYFLLKNKPKLDNRQVFYLVTSYLVVAFFSNLFLSGIFSSLSRYYQIRELDLISFFVMNIWLSLIMFTSFWRIKEQEFLDISSLYSTQEFYHKRYLYLFILIVVAITLGLGTNFIITAILLIIGIIFVTFNFQNLGLFFNFKIQNLRSGITNLKRPTMRSFRRSNIDESTEVLTSTTKTSNKKKKQKNKKKNRR